MYSTKIYNYYHKHLSINETIPPKENCRKNIEEVIYGDLVLCDLEATPYVVKSVIDNSIVCEYERFIKILNAEEDYFLVHHR